MNTHIFDDNRYLFRVLLSLVIGIPSALFLTWFMHVLIQSSHQQLDEAKRVHLLEFVRVKKAEQSQRAQRKLERPTQAPAPPAPPVAQAQSSADAGQAMTVELPATAALDSNLEGISIGGDGEYLPIIKVAPVYPPRAEQTGTEGDCTVIYTVTTTGAVRDVRVIPELCPNRIFERPSINAAEKFKYKPRIINGEAVEVEGIMNQFNYILQRNEKRN